MSVAQRITPPATVSEAQALLAQLHLPFPGRERFLALGAAEGPCLKNAICCLANGDQRAPQARAYLSAVLTANSAESLAALNALGYPDVPAEVLSRCIKEGDIQLPEHIQQAVRGNQTSLKKVRDVLSFVGNLSPVADDLPCEPPFVENEAASPVVAPPTPQQEAPSLLPPVAEVVAQASPVTAATSPNSEPPPALIRCADNRQQCGLSLIGYVMDAATLPRALAVCMGWQKEAVCGQLQLRYQGHAVHVNAASKDLGAYAGDDLFEFSDAILRTLMENRPHLSAESVFMMTKALFSGQG